MMDKTKRPTFEDLSNYIDGLVSESERSRIVAWLDGDPQLAAEYQLLVSLQDVLSDDEPEPEQAIFTNMRAAVLEQVKTERRNPIGNTEPWWLRLFSPQRLLPLAVGACALFFTISIAFQTDSGQGTSGGDEKSTTRIASTDSTQPPKYLAELDSPIPASFSQQERDDAMATVDLTRQIAVSTAGKIKERAGTFSGDASTSWDNLRGYLTTNGKALIATGSERAFDTADTLYDRTQVAGESLTEWSVRQNQINAGSSLISLALGAV